MTGLPQSRDFAFFPSLCCTVRGLQLTIIAMDLLALLPIFIAGFGCGYYARDRISSKRRERYAASKPDRKPGDLLTFETSSMRDLWQALRNLPPLK
jgi:hypothetical protein